jgi:phytanoyl-CoA hydroxylase
LKNNLKVLSSFQVNFFNSRGYLHVPSLLTEKLLSEVEKPIQRWVNRTIKAWIRKGFLADDFGMLPFESRLYKAWEAAGRPSHRQAITEELASKEMFDFISTPALVDVAHDLLDAEDILALKFFVFRPKLPSRAFAIDTPWHQDAQAGLYLNADKFSFITIWVPFVDVDEKNSCLQVSESSHIYLPVFDDAGKGGIHYSIDSSHSNTFTNLVAIPMKRGDILCIHPGLAHRALPNLTEKMRWSLDLRYRSLLDGKIPEPKQGFVCAHTNPALVVRNDKDAFQNLWDKQAIS